jgi:hypothetical protein
LVVIGEKVVDDDEEGLACFQCLEASACTGVAHYNCCTRHVLLRQK